MHKNQIKPSSDFTERTLQRILEMRQKREAISRAWISLLIFAPSMFRQAWLFMRRDYFSASHMPFGETIVSIYGFFISNMAFYLLLGISAAATFTYFWGRRRLSLAAKSLGQILNQARAKI